MPETARILRFPGRERPIHLSVEEAREIADRFLSEPLDERSEEMSACVLGNPDVLLAVCGQLRQDREVVPSVVALEAASLYRLIWDRGGPLGLFDEHDFFLGETAFLAGSAYRILGNRIEAFRWLDRAEAGFRHTVNPGVGLAEVAYNRLVVRFEMGHHEDVIELTDSLATSYVRLGDELGRAKCQLLKSKALTQVGKADRSLELLETIRHSPALASDPGILGHVLVDIGEHHSLAGRYPEATSCYQEALPLLKRANRPIALAHLKAVLGETFRVQGRPDVALESYRSALADYSTVGTTSWVAYLRVLVAETLLALDRPREAEWEILQALPTIEEQKMVPEGFAAVALLRESVKRRKADPNALRELREHLQKQK
jgi:tetratricopeptide (TPR) repeat protein